jgi:hypothetical protein
MLGLEYMIKEWLTKRTTFDQAEAENSVKDDRLDDKPVPFGFQNARWVEFRGKFREGDELWEFSSPPDTWQNLCGRAGVAIVRHGKIVDSFVTVMN